MTRNWILGIFLVLVFILLGLFLKPKSKEIDWTPSLQSESKEPFGTYVFFYELTTIFPKAKLEVTSQPLYNLLKDKSKTGSILFLLKYSGSPRLPVITQTDLDGLLKFIKNGNTVFLASNDLGHAFYKQFNFEIKADNFSTEPGIKGLRLKDSLQFGKGFYIMERVFSPLNYSIDENKKSRFTVLGINKQNQINFIKIEVGKGLLFIHTNPEVFTNFFILNKNNSNYLSGVLTYLPSGINQIYWEDYYQKTPIITSPLEYILSQPNLKMAAIYTFLVFILFVTFQIKRRQRIIPVISPLENKTLEFIETLGLLYFEKKDNKNLAEKMTHQFMENIRNIYQINPKEFTEDHLVFLSKKTGQDQELISVLIKQMVDLENKSQLTDQELLLFNERIQKFYN